MRGGPRIRGALAVSVGLVALVSVTAPSARADASRDLGRSEDRASDTFGTRLAAGGVFVALALAWGATHSRRVRKVLGWTERDEEASEAGASRTASPPAGPARGVGRFRRVREQPRPPPL